MIRCTWRATRQVLGRYHIIAESRVLSSELSPVVGRLLGSAAVSLHAYNNNNNNNRICYAPGAGYSGAEARRTLRDMTALIDR